MAEQDLDRSEEATPFKREESRQRGIVPKSADLAGWTLLTVGTLALIATADALAAAIAEVTARQLAAAGQVATLNGVGHGVLTASTALAIAAAPLVIAVMVAAVVGSLLQTGPVFSTQALAPDFSRIDPSQGLERLFSRRTLFDAFKLLLKLGALGLALWWALAAVLEVRLALSGGPAERLAAQALGLFTRASLVLLALLAAIAAVDFVFSRREHDRKLRMSRREVKDEHKRREGSPEVKSRRRRFMLELVRRAAALGRVKDSDVVITNPTHIAVALRYRPQHELAPVVMASGGGLLAARIRALAGRHGVPMVRRPELARALYRKARIGDAIPEDAYLGVAAIYRELTGRRAAAEAGR